MAKNKKKTSRQDLGIKIFLSLTAVLLVVVLLGSLLGSSGLLLRTTAPLSSANYKVDGAMMTYYYRTTYLNLVSSMGDYISYYLDTSKPLKSQTFLDGTQTWHDYLISSATEQAKQMLVLAEAAKAAGLSLTDEDYATIDENIAALKETASTYGYTTVNSFIAAQYGEGVKEKDLRNALELSLLANLYSEKMTNEIEVTEDKVNTYFAEHEEDYTYVGIRQYTFSAGEALEATDITDEEKNQLKADLKAHADALAATKTIEEYEAYLTQYMKDITADTGEITEENIASNLADTEYPTYNSRTTEQGEWAFSDDRKVGDTIIVEDEDRISYTVCMIERTKYRDEDMSRNVRHILFKTSNYADAAAAKAEADKILAEFEAGEKTEEAFAALANQYSEDPGSNTNGGLYENVMTGEMVTEFNDWLFDDARQVGDYAVVEAADTGAHIVYYVGEGMPEWEITVREDITNDEYNAAYEALEAATEIKESSFAMGLVG